MFVVVVIDADISEDGGGSGFSAGQKQLLALARAILLQSRIVVMDEATSSVDGGTERLLLDVVREAFAHCTVLTIAVSWS
jgi:ABC-type multidrug transport system fused ATPase/permease subunit